MGENEDIYIGDEEYEGNDRDGVNQNNGGAGIGANIMNMFNNMFGFGGGAANN